MFYNFFIDMNRIIKKIYIFIRNNFLILSFWELSFLLFCYFINRLDFNLIFNNEFVNLISYIPYVSILLLLYTLVTFYGLVEFIGVYQIISSSIKCKSISIKELFYEIKFCITNILKPHNYWVIILYVLFSLFGYVNFFSQGSEFIVLPNNIINFIYSNEIIYIVFTIIRIVLTILSLFTIFVFCEMFIIKNNFKASFLNSIKIVWQNRFSFLILLSVISAVLIFLSSILFAATIWIGFSINYLLGNNINSNYVLTLVESIFTFYYPMLKGIVKIGFVISLFCKFKKIHVAKLENKNHSFIIIILVFCLTFIYLYNLDKESNLNYFDYNKIPNIVAHRAGGLVAPENSLKALNLTYKSGIAQMIEVDVQLTKDNKVILLHDSTFERTLGINKRPEDMCYEDIIKYSMIDGFSILRNEKIPLLEDIIDNAFDLKIMIELKGPDEKRKKLLNEIHEIINTKKIKRNYIVASMKKDDLKLSKEINPQMQTCFITSKFNNEDLKLDYIDIYSIEFNSLCQELYNVAHLYNKEVYCWTVNKFFNIEDVLRANTDGVITDNIYAVKYLLNKKLEIVPFQKLIMDYFDLSI